MKAVARALTNTEVPTITITKNNGKTTAKQNIVIIARQHAGETWSSFLVEEIMKEVVEQKTEYSKWIA
jgi:murein tripeptide amidase MpaA